MSYLIRSQKSRFQPMLQHWTVTMLVVHALLIFGGSLAMADSAVSAQRYIVTKARQAQSVETRSAKVEGSVEEVSRQALNAADAEVWTFAPGMDEAAMMATMQADASVLFVEPDYQRQPHSAPNDAQFRSQWYAQNNGGRYFGRTAVEGADLGLVEAWALSKGSRDVVVAIIDNGVDLTHPDLRKNLWVNPGEIAGNGIDDDRNGFVDDVHGWDFDDRDADPSPAADLRNHGTAVAGVIGARGDNDKGLAGANWRVSIMVLKTDFSVSATIRAMEYARHNGAHIVNTSFGGSQFSQNEFQAVERLRNDGILMVASAGNEHWDNDFGASYPGSYPLDNILVVAATTPSDTMAAWSQHGQLSVDVAAPGDVIMTTEANGDDMTSHYGLRSGTSFSAPLVAGVAALIKSEHPGADYSELKGRIMAGVDSMADGACATGTGGRVNALSALQAAAQPVPALSQIEWLDGADGHVGANESATLRLEFETFWQSGGATQLRLTSGDSRLQVLAASQSVAAMPVNQRFTVDFPVQVGEIAGHQYVPLSVAFSAPGFSAVREFCLLASALPAHRVVRGNLQQDAQDDVHRFTVTVPAGAEVLALALAADSNADLYVRRGSWSTRDEVLRRSGSYGRGEQTFVASSASGAEQVVIERPAAGTWYVTVVNASQQPGSYRLMAAFSDEADMTAMPEVAASAPAAPIATTDAEAKPVASGSASGSDSSSGGGSHSVYGLLMLLVLGAVKAGWARRI